MTKQEELELLMSRDETEPEPRGPIIIPASEQETVICFYRGDEYATISTSDTTMKTKLNHLCESSEQYELTEEGPVNFYRVKDKTLLSFRKDKVKREMSEEQRQAAAERLRNARNK